MNKLISHKYKLSLLRNEMKKEACNYYILPRTDEYQNEFLPRYSERVSWLTGFSGSFAVTIISINKSIIFTDGRYIDQINKEVDKKLFKIININFKDSIQWLKENVKNKDRFILDSWLFSSKQFLVLSKIIKKKGGKINVKKEIFMDRIWNNKPKVTKKRIFIREEKYSGLNYKKKIIQIKTILKKRKIENFFFSSPASISWLLNIRSDEVQYTPIVLSFLIFNINQKSLLFLNNHKDYVIKKYLKKSIRIRNIRDLKDSLTHFAKTNSRITIDPSKTPYFVENFLKNKNVKIIYEKDPCIILKAKKNNVEIKGAKNAHIRDGVSIVKFLFWLDKNIEKNKYVSEKSASTKLYKLREKNKLFQGLSFETISGYGSNGSIVHYRVTEKSNKILKKNNLFLFDSGGQYLDGTTDITRTVSIGNPTNEQKNFFTRVLKGNIALTKTIFKKNVKGKKLDSIARQYLLEKKKDYQHGTGHGVGSFLNVHEGPQSISKKSETTFVNGMIVSNEPGFYKSNEYGIRIENLLLIIEKKKKLSFEVLTLAPIDTKLIINEMLTDEEKNWLNNYHINVFKKISGFLNKEENFWLKKNTTAI